MSRNSFLTAVSAVALCMASSSALATPDELSREDMDRVTAGGGDWRGGGNDVEGSGGAIVGNGSSATINSTGVVDLSGEALSNASALNLVNSSESTVANGVNVFDGRIEADANFAAGTHFEVNQLNDISQQQLRVASLPLYERPDANIDHTFTEVGTSSGSSVFSELNAINHIESVTDFKQNSIEGSVDAMSTILGQKIQAGRGVAVSGEVDVWFDGGVIDFTAAGGVTIGPVEFTGDVSVGIELPEFTVNVKGAGCGVMNGSCTSNGTFTETMETLSDHSTMFRLDTFEEFDRAWNNSGTERIRAPFTIRDAQAEYIVVDDSEIDVETSFAVLLSGSAQSGLSAMNVVNAAGSAVANGVNIAQQRAGNISVGGGPLLNLTQTNIIVHSR